MKKYHYSDGENHFGPFSIEELKVVKISKETMIWFEGLDNWIAAGEVEELKDLFKSIPPPLNINKQPPPLINKTKKSRSIISNSEIHPKKYKNKIVIGIVSLIGIIVIIAILKINSNKPDKPLNKSNEETFIKNSSYNSDENSVEPETSYSSNSTYTEPITSQPKTYTTKPRQKTEEALREELHQKEMKKPKDHLSVNYRLNYKVFSGKDEIIGKIYNSASMATFKDIVLTVVYSTETETELSRKDYVVYDYVYSNSDLPFSIKTYSPSGTKKIGVSIKSAKGE
jgi:hypothetical protein